MGLFDFIFGSSGKEYETTTREIPEDEIPEYLKKCIVTKELEKKESEKKEPKD